jgi:hypothetical protein
LQLVLYHVLSRNLVFEPLVLPMVLMRAVQHPKILVVRLFFAL